MPLEEGRATLIVAGGMRTGEGALGESMHASRDAEAKAEVTPERWGLAIEPS